MLLASLSKDANEVGIVCIGAVVKATLGDCEKVENNGDEAWGCVFGWGRIENGDGHCCGTGAGIWLCANVGGGRLFFRRAGVTCGSRYAKSGSVSGCTGLKWEAFEPLTALNAGCMTEALSSIMSRRY